MKRKNTKTAKARSFMQSNPAASVNEVANRFDLTKQSIYVLRNTMKRKGFVFLKRADQLATLAPALPMPEDSQKLVQTGIEMYEDEVDATLDARAV